MAHQAHHIPWTVLQSHIRPVCPGNAHEPANFQVCNKSQQGKELTYFVEAFARNITAHSDSERRKFSTYDTPAPTDILIEDAAARRIAPTVLHARQRSAFRGRQYPALFGAKYKPPTAGVLCRHDAQDMSCGCILPAWNRTAEAFLISPDPEPGVWHQLQRRFKEEHSWGFFNAEVVKALLMHGQMEPLLKWAKHPQCDFMAWQTYYGMGMDRREGQALFDIPERGWEKMYKLALRAYLVLNIAYLFPSTWDAASGRTPAVDYRNTELYQRMFVQCTLSKGESEVVRFPHRQFFGVRDGDITKTHMPKRIAWFDPQTGLPCATVPFPRFVDGAFRGWSHTASPGLAPSTTVINHVGTLLRIKGLPGEIIHEILELADLKLRGRLAVMPNNPLHPENWREMIKYLTYCWVLLVRCDVLAREVGGTIDWHDEIISLLSELSSAHGREWCTYDADERTWRFK